VEIEGKQVVQMENTTQRISRPPKTWLWIIAKYSEQLFGSHVFSKEFDSQNLQFLSDVELADGHNVDTISLIRSLDIWDLQPQGL